MHRLLIVLLMKLLIAAAPLHAQQPFPSLPSGPFPSVAPLPPTPEQVELQRVIAKANKPELLTEDEFMTYLRGVEEAPKNRQKGFTWGHLVSKLHIKHYAKDVGTPLLGWFLFEGSGTLKEGVDNQGFMEVDELIYGAKEVTGKHFFWGATSESASFVPRDIIDKQGNKVEIAHAYAGARAACNQTVDPAAILNAHVNLGWGDEYQQDLGDAVHGAGWLAARVHLLWNKDVKLPARPNYKPEKQTRGNVIGMWLWMDFVYNKKLKLSDAFARAFQQYHEGKDPHVFGNNPMK